MSNKGSDKNVANIEVIEDFILELKSFGLNKDTLEVANELENLLAEREQMLKAINTVEKEKGEWIEECEQKDKRIQELEEENKKVKAQHVFTRNEATDEEKAEIYDVIDKSVDEFLEKEKPIWEQEIIASEMSLEEAINFVDAMYQDKYKMIEENNTIYVDRLKDVKFTNLEFASVILLREVQSLQSKLKNSIPTQVVIDKIKENSNIEKEIEEKIKEEENSGDICREYIRDLKRQKGLVKRDILTLQELLEGERK